MNFYQTEEFIIFALSLHKDKNKKYRHLHMKDFLSELFNKMLKYLLIKPFSPSKRKIKAKRVGKRNDYLCFLNKQMQLFIDIENIKCISLGSN